MTNLKHLRELAMKATPGQWHNGTVHVYQTNHITRDVWNIAAPPKNTLHNNWEKDREYIASASPSTMLELLNLIEAQQKKLEICVEALEYYADQASWFVSDNGGGQIDINDHDGLLGGKRARSALEKLRGLG